MKNFSSRINKIERLLSGRKRKKNIPDLNDSVDFAIHRAEQGDAEAKELLDRYVQSIKTFLQIAGTDDFQEAINWSGRTGSEEGQHAMMRVTNLIGEFRKYKERLVPPKTA